MKPVTLFNPKKVINKNSEINNITSPICIPRSRPRKRLYQEDQYESFISKNSVRDFTCLNESFPPVGILLEAIRPCLILQVRKKTICQYLKWQTVSELTQNYISTLYSKGRLSHYPNGFTMEEIDVCLQKYVKNLSCLFAVTKGLTKVFLCTWRIKRT